MSGQESCHCGRPMLARPDELDATCAECKYKPDHCPCDPVTTRPSDQLSTAADHDDEVTLAPIPAYPLESLCGPLRDFVDWAVKDGLPAAAAGAAGLAALATVAGYAEVLLSSTVSCWPALWITPIGNPGCGKSPARIQAFREIERLYAAERHEWKAAYAKYKDEMEAFTGDSHSADAPMPPGPPPQGLVSKDATVQAVARWLDANGGCGSVVMDEAKAMLAGLSEWERGRYMEAWTARDSWHIQRVGDGGNQNGIDILVERPVLSIFGPLTPESVKYLGKEGDGFRSRWLVHLVEGRADMLDAGPQPDSWTLTIRQLWEAREVRQWELTGAANNRYQRAKNRWREQQSEPQPQSVIEALRKADTQCARIAVILAESLSPGYFGPIPDEAMSSAVALTDYVIGCWKALPGGSVLNLTMLDEKLGNATDELLVWLENRPAGVEGLTEGSTPRPRASRREIQAAKVGGARDPEALSAMIGKYSRQFPGCVVDAQQGGKGGGKPRIFVYFPRREALGAHPIGVDATPIGVVSPYAPDDERPGQTVVDPRNNGVARVNTDSGYTVLATPIGADLELRNVRCPACSWRFQTAVQSGENAWCKKCSHQFTVPGGRS